MDIRDISVPEIYKSSSDFRFFIELFADALAEIKYDTENIIDCYDPLRCKSELLWMLADTMGYKLDDRLPISFNRLVLLYFMSMIRNKGSKDGITLAAEVNLTQFNLIDYIKENDALEDRLEDTSIFINGVYVTPNVEEGFIEVVYMSDELPIDSCIEYVRPLGMYVFQKAGLRLDARSKVFMDARLANENDLGKSIGSTKVGYYTRSDYASIQKTTTDGGGKVVVDEGHTQEGNVFHRNSDIIESKDTQTKRYRTLNSVQLCNNEHIVKSTLAPIFDIGYTTSNPDDPNKWNLIVNRTNKEAAYDEVEIMVSYGSDVNFTETEPVGDPSVNSVMYSVGDAIHGSEVSKT